MSSKIVLVRGNRSGVHYGELVSRKGKEVTLKNARRIWRWDGANAINELAKSGTSKKDGCKFTVVVDEILILDAIEIYPLSEQTIANLDSVKVWKF